MSLLRDAWRHAPTHHRVWALAGPMILSNVSVPLVHLVDSTVVGHLPHAYQLGAVAVGGSLYTLMVGVLGFLRMGTTGFAAQAAGRDDGGALRLILAQGLGMALLLALLLGALALPLSGWALQLMQPSAELTGEARAFFHTRLLGLPAALASYALVGWFLGTQNARAPLAILLTTNLSNIALVLWFVHGLDWGVQGAARASVLAEWSGALLGLALTRRDLARRPGRAQWQRLRHWLSWLPLLMVNRDIFIRSLALQLVFFLLTVQGTRLGDATVAANALLLNGLLLTSYALDGLAHAVEALCGHAIGARDRAALRRVGRCWQAWRSPRCSPCSATCSSTCRATSPASAKSPTPICRTWPACRCWGCGAICSTACSSAPPAPARCVTRCSSRWPPACPSAGCCRGWATTGYGWRSSPSCCCAGWSWPPTAGA